MLLVLPPCLPHKVPKGPNLETNIPLVSLFIVFFFVFFFKLKFPYWSCFHEWL